MDDNNFMLIPNEYCLCLNVSSSHYTPNQCIGDIECVNTIHLGHYGLPFETKDVNFPNICTTQTVCKKMHTEFTNS